MPCQVSDWSGRYLTTLEIVRRVLPAIAFRVSKPILYNLVVLSQVNHQLLITRQYRSQPGSWLRLILGEQPLTLLVLQMSPPDQAGYQHE